MYVCMYVCIYVCMYVCMYVCVYVWSFKDLGLDALALPKNIKQCCHGTASFQQQRPPKNEKNTLMLLSLNPPTYTHTACLLFVLKRMLPQQLQKSEACCHNNTKNHSSAIEKTMSQTKYFSVRFCTPSVPARSFNQWSNRLALSFPWQLQKIDAERFDWNSTIRFKGCGRWKRSSRTC